MRERASRRVLFVVGLLLVVLLALIDLSRPDSVLRATWRRLTRQDTPLERVLKPFRGADLSRPARERTLSVGTDTTRSV